VRFVIIICFFIFLSESWLFAQGKNGQLLTRRPDKEQKEAAPENDVRQAATDTSKPEPKSESTALGWSLWGTLVPLPTLYLTVPGLIVGPSLGYFYAGMSGRALIGIGIRTVAVGGIIAVLGIGLSDNIDSEDEPYIAALGFGSILLLVVDVVHDISVVKSHVRKRNAKLQESGWRISPQYFSESQTVGLNISYSF
jgi:hypothetical protein